MMVSKGCSKYTLNALYLQSLAVPSSFYMCAIRILDLPGLYISVMLINPMTHPCTL